MISSPLEKQMILKNEQTWIFIFHYCSISRNLDSNDSTKRIKLFRSCKLMSFRIFQNLSWKIAPNPFLKIWTHGPREPSASILLNWGIKTCSVRLKLLVVFIWILGSLYYIRMQILRHCQKLENVIIILPLSLLILGGAASESLIFLKFF